MADQDNGMQLEELSAAERRLFQRLSKEVACPYCRQAFMLREMEFMMSNGANPFKPMVIEEESTETREGEELSRSGPTNTSLRQRNEKKPAQPEHSELVSTQNTEQQYGVPNVDDRVAQHFLHKYGEGQAVFRYERHGTFYKIGTEQKAREDRAYGYVSEQDGWDGDAPKMLHIINADGEDFRITSRLCPRCHCDLPPGYYACPEERKFSIALAGGSSSGKTQFITLALRNLVSNLGSLNLGTAALDHYSEWMLDVYMAQLKKNSKPDATRKEFQLLPFLVSITPKGKPKHFVAIHDIPGEYTGDHDVAVNRIKHADLVLMMLDASYMFRDKAKIPEGSLRCELPPESALAVFSQYDLCRDTKGIIVVMTKIDTIFNLDPPIIHGGTNDAFNGMILYENNLSVHKGAVNQSILRTINDEILTRVLGETESNLEERLLESFGQEVPMSFLGVSTWIKGQNDQFELKPDAVSGRHRLMEPLLKAFADLGILASTEELPQEQQPVTVEPVVQEIAPPKWQFWKKNRG